MKININITCECGNTIEAYGILKTEGYNSISELFVNEKEIIFDNFSEGEVCVTCVACGTEALITL